MVIIQHPAGAFKQFALEPIAIRDVDPHVVQYIADTQQGSSGSPVFNIRMQVIALHHAEAEMTVDSVAGPETIWRNEGIRIERVIKGLADAGINYVPTGGT